MINNNINNNINNHNYTNNDNIIQINNNFNCSVLEK